MIKLTDWESGKGVWIRSLADIRSMRRLRASVSSAAWSGPPHDMGERTRIDTVTDQMLVRETPEEIMAMFEAREAVK